MHIHLYTTIIPIVLLTSLLSIRPAPSCELVIKCCIPRCSTGLLNTGGMMVKKYKPGGIFIERKIYQSDAFLSLGKNSIKILIALLDNRMREPKRHAKDKKGNSRKRKFINLDRLEIPYGMLEKVYKINRSSIPAALDELLAKGFIRISHHGGARKHDKSKYAWSDNYLIWSSKTLPFETRPKDARRGYQGRRIGATKPTDGNDQEDFE